MLLLLLAALLVVSATQGELLVWKLGARQIYLFLAAQIKFQSFQFVKKQGPAAIAEGKQSVYTVIMDAPPDKNVKLELSTVDGYIR